MKLYVIKGRTLFFGILAAIAVCVCIGAGAQVQSVFRVGNREIPIYCVERDDNRLALTFNCAWNDSDIDAILTTLDEYGVKATFFAVGDWAEKYPEALAKIDAHGHEIGNHSYNHAHYSQMGKDAILADIQKADDVIEQVTGKDVTLFRAAYGEYTDDVVKACDETGRVYIQWSVDSIDYGDAAKADIVNRVLSKAKAGDIVLMHNGTKNTAAALPEILAELTKKYELCTVSDLIYKDNYVIDGTGQQIKA